MEKITDWTEIGIQSLIALGQSIMYALPSIFGAIFLIILGWIIAKILAFVIRKALKLVGFDKASEKINVQEMLGRINITTTPSRLVGKFVYWIIILLFFVTASDTLGWTVVSESIVSLISYLPKLFSAIIIFIIGYYIATFVKQGLKGILESLAVSSANIISGISFYIILIIISLTALDQAGVDTAILTSNVTVVIGGIILAFAVSFGIGSRDVLSNILASFYTKRNFVAGQEIELHDVKGKIEKIDNISCLIKTTDGTTVIPVKRLLSENVNIKGTR